MSVPGCKLHRLHQTKSGCRWPMRNPPISSVPPLSASYRSGCWGSRGIQCRYASPEWPNKMIFGSAGHISDVAPLSAFGVQYSGTSAHDVTVNVDRINGVCDTYAVIVPEDISDIARIAFGTVVDKYLCR